VSVPSTTDPFSDLVALVVAPGELGVELCRQLAAGLDGLATVELVPDVDAARHWCAASGAVVVPLVAVTDHVGDVDAAVRGLDECAPLGRARVLLLTARGIHTDVAEVVDRERLHSVVPIPWIAGALGGHTRSQVLRWLRDHRGGDDPSDAQTQGQELLEAPGSALLRDLELGPEEVTARLLAAIERALGPRPRLRLPSGVRVTRQGRSVDGVFVVVEGSVALDRDTPVGELRLHHDTTGPVVGILALAQQRRAFFTARTTSDVEVIHLTLEQLDRAIRTEPEMGAALTAVSIRALARRLRRSEQLQVEKVELNRELTEERQRLRDTLEQLEAARFELIEQARFATLGELAAGVAHELNNPVAALTRAASYVTEDLLRLLAAHPQGAVARAALDEARTRPPRSTAQERASRRELEQALGDSGLARRMLAAGVEDPQRATELAGDETRLALVEAAAGIGAAVRNLDVAAGRIGELVASLRAYARPDAEPAPVDVATTLEDALRVAGHRLRGVRVERDYGEVPLVMGHPGQLGQVWTNLLVNAAEALEGDGSIRLTTDSPAPDRVRVRITDDGPGVPVEVQQRLFEPRFTTKHGVVRYGLGLGLAISRHLVEQHGGEISLESDERGTTVTVLLPAAEPSADTGGLPCD
jgi:signal transduction histidine kinase